MNFLTGSILGGGNLRFADINGDGILDVATFPIDSNGPLIIFLGSGEGNYDDPLHFVFRQPGVSDIFADLNGDGLLDLIAREFVSLQSRV